MLGLLTDTGTTPKTALMDVIRRSLTGGPSQEARSVWIKGVRLHVMVTCATELPCHLAITSQTVESCYLGYGRVLDVTFL